MPIQNIYMNFYKNVRPIEKETNSNYSFNTRAPTAKYYRKTIECCDNNQLPSVIKVFKNVKSCCNGFSSLSSSRSANTAFPVDLDTGKKPDYSQSRIEYLQSRCKGFKQRSFNFLYDNETNQAFANCCGEDPNTYCSKVYYKPNNAKFSQQGAVSGSNRLLRLKYDTITTSGKFNTHRILYRGDYTQNVFINKGNNCKTC